MKGIAGEQMSDHLSLTIFFIPTSTIKMDALKKHLLASAHADVQKHPDVIAVP
jgi:hypothetical protein